MHAKRTISCGVTQRSGTRPATLNRISAKRQMRRSSRRLAQRLPRQPRSPTGRERPTPPSARRRVNPIRVPVAEPASLSSGSGVNVHSTRLESQTSRTIGASGRAHVATDEVSLATAMAICVLANDPLPSEGDRSGRSGTRWMAVRSTRARTSRAHIGRSMSLVNAATMQASRRVLPTRRPRDPRTNSSP